MAPQQLANFFGTGTNPHIKLRLGVNGPNWGSYEIDFGHVGNVPYSSDPSQNWSTWDAYDEFGNYYGTITLKSDGNSVDWGDYVSQGDYYFDGIHFKFDRPSGAYQLNTDQIFRPTNNSPFPNAPKAQPATYTNTNKPINLQVSGNKIVDDYGREVTLKGVVRPSLEWNAQGAFLSPDDIQRMAGWGSNVIRLDLNQNYWLSSDAVTVNGSYKQIIDAIIYYATQNGMAVILDLHWTVDGQQSPMANQDSLKFWQEVAQAYQGFGTVIFELFNEPYSIDQNTWLNGNDQYVGYQTLYNTVRQTGAQNLVITNGLDWGYDLSFVNWNFHINGTNIIYGSHPYNEKGAPDYTGPGGNFQNCYKGIIGQCPLMFTEFGVDQASYFPDGYQAVYQRILNYSNSVNANYTAFAWWSQDGDPQFPTLIADWNGTPLNGGVLVNQDLQQNAPTKFFSPPSLVYNPVPPFFPQMQTPVGFQMFKPAPFPPPYNPELDIMSAKPNYKELVLQELYAIQAKFNDVWQASQRKEVIQSCWNQCLDLPDDVDAGRLKQIIRTARFETFCAHEDQLLGIFCCGVFLGKSRTVKALDDLLNTIVQAEKNHSEEERRLSMGIPSNS